MQYSLSDLLKEEHILLNLEAQDSDSVILALAAAMRMSGHVDQAYAEDVIEREKVFPTGLPTEPIPVAIPHADPPHVFQSAIGIAVLAETVEFGMMGTGGSETVDAKIVVLLAIKEQEKQVDMLQQLIKVIQSGELLKSLIKVQEAEEAVKLLKNYTQ